MDYTVSMTFGWATVENKAKNADQMFTKTLIKNLFANFHLRLSMFQYCSYFFSKSSLRVATKRVHIKR